jgi:RNA polymerase sigma-70 factor (ECF subfamily)
VTDADLLDRARRGDSTAFDALVHRHQTAVFRAALAAVGSPADAEDVAQEAFMLAYTRLASFRGHASFKTWLLTITWNHAINHRRSMRRWWTRMVSMTGSEREPAALRDWIEPASGDPDPEQSALGDRLRHDIRREIRALSPKLRDALLLAQSGEYDYMEIAAMLKVAVGTVKWRVSEARRIVKERLQARGYSHAG